MGHSIEFFTYDEKKKKSEILDELSTYVSHATWQEGGHGISKIRWYDSEVLPDYAAAEEFLDNHDKGWYDQLAVRYKEKDTNYTTKKLTEMKSRCSALYKQYHTFANKVVASDFKSQFIGCKYCNSKINKDYLKTNYCPVCQHDMRSETNLKKIAAMKQKLKELESQIRLEEQKMAQKHGKVKWLVKIEYHL